MGLAYLIYLGLALKIAGFMVREEWVLRTLVSIGMFCDLLFYALQSPPIYPSVLSNGVLFCVNSGVLAIIVWERTTIGMSAEARALFRHFHTLTPGQFRVLLRIAEVQEVTVETVLARSGERLHALYFVETGVCRLRKGDIQGEILAPAFIGEIAFLKNTTASATVTVEKGTIYVAWPVERLHHLLDRRSRLRNALMSHLAMDMADKVALSVPLALVDTS